MPGIDVTTTLGPILIGQLLSTIVFGITILQTYLYFTKYAANDRPILKTLVAMTVLFEIVHVFLGFHLTYFYLITAFGNVNLLEKLVWSFQLIGLAGAQPVFLIQSFFAHRIYILSKGNVWAPCLIILLSVAQLVDVVFWTREAFRQTTISGLLIATNRPAIVGFGMDISSNAMITIFMIYYLRKQSTPFANTRKVLDLLITYTLKTCMLITACSLTAEIMLALFKFTFKFSPAYELATRFYANSLLSTLNNRESIREKIKAPSNRLRFSAGTASNILNLSELGAATSSSAPNTTTDWDVKSKEEV